MTALWEELKASGLQEVIARTSTDLQWIADQPLLPVPGCDGFIWLETMTGKEVHIATQNIIKNVDKAREQQITTLQAFARQRGMTEEELAQAVHNLADMTDCDVLVNMPAFIRLCLELQKRGHILEDVLYIDAH